MTGDSLARAPISLSPDHSSYLLATGQEDRERLELLAELYNPPSYTFLARVIDPSIRSVLDIGCGHGSMSRWFDRRLPADGRIVGMDRSLAQVALCQAHPQAKSSQRMAFWQADITEQRSWECCFDLLYSRFLLLHLADWAAFFANLRALCRPGGAIVLEEPAFPFFAYPVHSSLERANELGLRLTQLRGLHFDCAPLLWGYLQDLGLEIRQVQFHQPTLYTPTQKKLLYLSFIQIREPLLAAGLACAEEIDAIAADLLAMADDPRCIAGSLRMLQLHLGQPTDGPLPSH